MNTCLEKITNALCTVEEACVFARSKLMKRLIGYNKNGQIIEMMLALFSPLFALGFCFFLLDMGWVSPISACILTLLFLFLVPCAYVLARSVWLNEAIKKSRKANVVGCENADQNAPASVKMSAIDKCQKILPQEQMDTLKTIAQREDVPLGWWQNIVQIAQEHTCNAIKTDNHRNELLSEQRAQERLVLLSVSAAQSSHSSSMGNKNSKRLIV